MTEVIVSNSEYKVCQRCNRIRKILRYDLCTYCYVAKRRYIKHINSPMIDCACGCGEMIHSLGSHGQPQKFKTGHNSRVAHWAYNFGIRYHVKGYLEIYQPDHSNATNLGYIGVHRFFMSLALGRPLEKDEDVHHIDGNIYNNDQSNLQLLKHGEHSTLTGFSKTDGRICCVCGTDKTYVKKNGWRVWAACEDGWLCRKCNRKRLWKLKGKT